MSTRLSRLFGGNTARKASRGALSDYVVTAYHQYGQPIINPGDAFASITPERMREIAVKTPTIAACRNVVLDYVASVPIIVRNIDTTKKAPTRAKALLEDMLRNPNKEDTGKEFREKLFDDMFVIGFAAVEMEPNKDGGVANLWALDGARVRVDYDEHGTTLGYDMLDARGFPIVGRDGVHAWTPDEVVFYRRRAKSQSRYAYADLAACFSLGVIEQMVLAFVSGRFEDSNIPAGLLDLGDLTPDELSDAVTLWNQQMKELGNNKLMLTASKGGMKYQSFADQLKDMDAPKLLLLIRSMLMGILGVTVNELGEASDVNKSNGFNLSYAFKKRAIEPMLNAFVERTTKTLVQGRLGFKDCELYYEEIDSRDELLQAQIDDLYWKTGIWTINRIRNRKGEPSVPGGDEPHVVIGSNAVPVALLTPMAQGQLDLLTLEAQMMKIQMAQAMQAMVAAAQPGVDAQGNPTPGAPLPQVASPPMLRQMQEPMRWTAPDANGSTTTKLTPPKPAVTPPTSKPARGPVEANQRAGNRKDDTQPK